MRIAALYDIHANPDALAAVLDDVRAAGVERLVFGGDVLPGPLPIETLDLIASHTLPAHFIAGNGETAVLAHLAGRDLDHLPAAARDAIRWTAGQLRPADRRLIASWPATVRLTYPTLGDLLFCHATPRSDTEIFTRLTPEERLLPIFEPARASIVVCGHTHMQFIRAVGTTRVVNCGSVGMPFGAPGAYWLLLGDSVELRRTSYDLDAAAARIRASQYPQAQEFAERHVVNPPSEETMLALMAQGDLR
ncbi:MAG: metallophosphoesterase family protein [Gemmatimonadota bacterium]